MWLRFSVFSFLSGGKHFSHASSAASWWLTLTSHVVPTRGWNVLVHREGRGFIWSRANIQEQNTLFFRDPSNVAIKHLSQRYLTEAGFTGSTQIPILGVKSIQILIYRPIFTFFFFFFCEDNSNGISKTCSNICTWGSMFYSFTVQVWVFISSHIWQHIRW